MATPLNVGLIGYGFMGRTHSNAYRKVNSFFDLDYHPVLKVACARDEDKVKSFAEKWGYESVETDWKKLIERDDIDIVDICVPNNLHRDIAISAAEAGKTVLCEKPLAMNSGEGEEMVKAVEKTGVANMVWYNYRRVPAVTFIKERMHNLTGKVEPVGIDDACAFLARFTNGSLATFESTRYARGHKALYIFEINGEHASLAWDLHDLHRLSYFDHREESIVRGWRSIHVTDSDMPYMDKWWVPGLQIGYEHTFVHQVADFLEGLSKDHPASPTFRDALETQRVCDAVLRSASTQKWESVPT